MDSLGTVLQDKFIAWQGDFRRRSWAGWSVWLEREKEGLKNIKIGEGKRRVVVIRHGMGYHNDWMGAVSAFNRDSLLNHSGLQQATLLHHQLRSQPNSFNWKQAGLIIVSPFRRTLQTCMYVVAGKGADEQWEENQMEEFGHLLPFEVNPFVAEHSLGRSFVQQGDRGSKRKELEKEGLFGDWFNWDGIDSYCLERDIPDGQWWHHHPCENFESQARFQDRTEEMRMWLTKKCFSLPQDKITFVFSHGGLLTSAFAPTERFGNCEMRVFDLSSDGSFTRISHPIETMPSSLSPLPSSRDGIPICPLSLQPIQDAGVDKEGNVYEFLEIFKWVEVNGTSPLTGRKMVISDLKCIKNFTLEDINSLPLRFDVENVELKDCLFTITGKIDGEPFQSTHRLSSIRTTIHHEIKASLSPDQYAFLFPSHFPSLRDPPKLEKWLKCLGNGFDFLSPQTQNRIISFFQGEKMEEGGLFVQDTPFAKGGGGGVFVVGGVEQWGEVFRVSGVVLGVEFDNKWRLSAIRELVHDPLRQSLSSQQYSHIFSTSFPSLRNAEKLFQWLKCLGQGLFSVPSALIINILSFFSKKKVLFEDEQFLFDEVQLSPLPPSPSSPSNYTSFPSLPPPSAYVIQTLEEGEKHFFSVSSVYFDGKDRFTVSGEVDFEPFEGIWRLSQIRDNIHQVIRNKLSDPLYRSFFSVKFPKFRNRDQLFQWLKCLSICVGSLPSEIQGAVVEFFGGKKSFI